jgi:hypothetical protein
MENSSARRLEHKNGEKVGWSVNTPTRIWS